jgi:hypothetical protein
MTASETTDWKPIGVVIEGRPIRIRDVNVWGLQLDQIAGAID